MRCKTGMQSKDPTKILSIDSIIKGLKMNEEVDFI